MIKMQIYDPNVWRSENATAIYLSGPMTGIPEFNFPAFTAACESLRAAGHVVVSPHELIDGTDQPWSYYIRHDLIAMLMHCNSIARLPGFENSKGACVENYVAMLLGFDFYNVIDNQLVKRQW